MALSAQFNDKDKQTGTVTAINRIHAGGAEIYMIRIRPPQGFSYKAGQYVEIGFGKLTPRSYSIANDPGQKDIEVHIKRAQGEASLYIASVLQVGDAVGLSDAQGGSVYDPADKRPLLIIAGGMGFTPVKAVAEAAVHRDANATVHFYWGTQAADEQYMRAHFEDMAREYDNFRFHSVSGTPVGDAVLRDMGDLSAYRIYVAGPPAMIDALVPRLMAQGAHAAAISYDTPKAPPGAAGPGQRKPS